MHSGNPNFQILHLGNQTSKYSSWVLQTDTRFSPRENTTDNSGIPDVPEFDKTSKIDKSLAF